MAEPFSSRGVAQRLPRNTIQTVTWQEMLSIAMCLNHVGEWTGWTGVGWMRGCYSFVEKPKTQDNT